MKDDQIRIQELVEILNQAGKAYYQEDRELMSNLEYDRMYDELQELEERTGTVLANSPTITVGYESVEDLPKEAHKTPMLSLNKTKDQETLREFAGDHETLLSWKLDGLTIVLTYREGSLYKAVTRGNGVIGEVVTNNARTFCNLPLKIPYERELVLRGEAIITYTDFEKINGQIQDTQSKYKNPRNLCSGSVRQLNNEITAGRHVRFFAFALVSAEGELFFKSHSQQMEWLKKQGFQIVEYRMVTADTLEEGMAHFESQVGKNDFPSDGLVAIYDDIAYGEGLGSTSKFPRNALAFKWADELRETTLLEMEWSASRTGLINPVAIFAPVELEGTTVSRASVHNISIVEELALGIGDRIEVYKANMIIPQIARNLTKSGTLEVPNHCPVCNGIAKIRRENDVKALYCTNGECPAKKLKAFTLFVSRDAMNIDGLSEATLEKFIARGYLKDFGDLYELSRYEEEIVEMEGLGRRSYDNLMESIEQSRHTSLPRVLYGLGILNIGLANAKLICKAFDYEVEKIKKADEEAVSAIDGIGPVIAGNLVEYFSCQEHLERLEHLLSHLELEQEIREERQNFAGMNFVITGSVYHFENRAAVKEVIESMGGKVTGTVTSKTNYLINNDTTSNSSKNRKAKELGVPIISEEDFMALSQ